MIIKQRAAAGKIKSMHLIGNVKGKDCIIFDDMVDTGGTLCNAATDLKKFGAKRIYCFASHGLFSTGKKAIDRIEKSDLEAVVVTNSVPEADYEKNSKKIVRLESGYLFGEAIKRIQCHKSISDLFYVRPAKVKTNKSRKYSNLNPG